MKFGIRVPSLKKRISARTSLKRMVRAKVRVPRGMGMVTNPKRALYNKVYNRTSVSVDRLASSSLKRSSSTGSSLLGLKIIGYIILIGFLIVVWPLGLLVLAYLAYRFFSKPKKVELLHEPLPDQVSDEGKIDD